MHLLTDVLQLLLLMPFGKPLDIDVLEDEVPDVCLMLPASQMLCTVLWTTPPPSYCERVARDVAANLSLDARQARSSSPLLADVAAQNRRAPRPRRRAAPPCARRRAPRAPGPWPPPRPRMQPPRSRVRRRRRARARSQRGFRSPRTSTSSGRRPNAPQALGQRTTTMTPSAVSYTHLTLPTILLV